MIVCVKQHASLVLQGDVAKRTSINIGLALSTAASCWMQPAGVLTLTTAGAVILLQRGSKQPGVLHSRWQ